jgi:RimJ/RimL family protein N-acetyltransferase
MGEAFTIKPLQASDAPKLASMLCSQPVEYVRFFTPFDFDQATISNILDKRKQDVYMGMYWQNRLVGFFMLRGWDEGYEVPTYGVLVDEKFSGYGLTTASLRMAKTICKLCRSPRIMLKVHLSNSRAKRIFERAGFIQTGIDRENDTFIYHFDLDGRPA